MVIEAILLEQVEDAETVCDPRKCSCDPEVEPLCVSARVQICLQDQLVVELASVNGTYIRGVKYK